MAEMFLKDWLKQIYFVPFENKIIDTEQASFHFVSEKIRVSQGGKEKFKLPLLQTVEKSGGRISFDCLSTDYSYENPLPEIDPYLTVAIDAPDYPGGLIGYIPHISQSATGVFVSISFVPVSASNLYFKIKQACDQKDFEKAGDLVDQMDRRSSPKLPGGWAFTNGGID